jgi:hypothetical protein
MTKKAKPDDEKEAGAGAAAGAGEAVGRGQAPTKPAAGGPNRFEQAMSEAILQAAEDGVTDPEEIRNRISDARARVKAEMAAPSAPTDDADD